MQYCNHALNRISSVHTSNVLAYLMCASMLSTLLIAEHLYVLIFIFSAKHHARALLHTRCTAHNLKHTGIHLGGVPSSIAIKEYRMPLLSYMLAMYSHVHVTCRRCFLRFHLSTFSPPLASDKCARTML